ncbi:response regulator transcription factor [Aquimarina muelleri]|uniref:DNA-binding response regulator n=1 Tax=Aquimarina muelleri TaxID=279356 RepID=A0A918N3G3_9FLAO|nr:response regulator transcription factor [Aquimarina muelleri]MCX2761390.1 response regulator transcription factor [Aquimarina muelleri]GGX13308.1 DNA-binding response regulator [Aquimarina muelleri]
MKYSIVIVEDHILLSQALSGLVNGFAKFKILYICKNGKELLTRLKDPKNIPDIVLMDINMPIMNGIETTAVLKEEYPQIKVLALSVEENENTILKMLRAGAKGYLLKDTEKSILESALIQVQETGFYHTKDVTKLLLGSLNNKKEKEIVLKDREIEFIKHACTEKTYKEIANDMCLSPKTIEGYRDSIFEKLQLKNRTGLVIYAIKSKLFVP